MMVTSLIEKGVRLHRAGDMDAAAAVYEDALRADPSNADALHLLGLIAHGRGHVDDGIALIEKAIERAPEQAVYHKNLAQMLRKGGRQAEAAGHYARAGALAGDAECWSRASRLYEATGDTGKAVDAALRATEIAPTRCDFWATLARAARAADDHAQADRAYRKVLETSPLSGGDPVPAWPAAEIRRQVALSLRYLDRSDEAERQLREAATLAPGDASARYDLAELLLADGRFSEGFECYEARLTKRERTAWFDPSKANISVWNGEDLQGKHLMLLGEQGYGDAIFFARYLPLLRDLGARVTLVGNVTPLTRLLQDVFGVECVDWAEARIPHPCFCLYIGSLPHRFSTTPETVPSPDGYLPVEPAAGPVSAAQSETLDVGLVLSGNPRHSYDAARSIDPALFEGPLSLPGIRWTVLQPDFDISRLQAVRPKADIRSLRSGIGDFADTARAIAGLDLTISVDTAVAHLAGALGRPVWLLNRHDGDWRWGNEGERTPWYTSMRIFRQGTDRSWGPVVAAVRQALEERLATGPAPSSAPAAAAPPHRQTEAGPPSKVALPALSPSIEPLLEEGVRLQNAGNPALAITKYEEALGRDPASAEAMHLLGLALDATGRTEEGLQRLRQAIERAPDAPLPIFNLAQILGRLGRHEERLPLLERFVELRPNDMDVRLGLASTLIDLDRADDARQCLRELVSIDPRHAMGWRLLGELALTSGDSDEARQALEQAIAGHGENAGVDLQVLYGRAQLACGDIDDALQTFVDARRKAPQDPEAAYLLGMALYKKRDYDSAIEAFEAAAKLEPENWATLRMLGMVMRLTRRIDDGVAWLRRAVQADPTLAPAHFDLGLMLLRQGEWVEGWQEMEWRWHQPPLVSRGKPPGHEWGGEPLYGQNVFVHPEQGYGDSIQMARYVPLIAERGGKVALGTYTGLDPLFRSIPGVQSVSRTGAKRPPYDCYVPMMSLPRIFRSTPETVPAAGGYLSPPDETVKTWAKRLGPAKKLRVGVVWAGRPDASYSDVRSIVFDDFASIFDLDNIDFFSLQVGATAAEADRAPDRLVRLDDKIEDFADTAAIMLNLDLIISVETAAAHLAGALGVPVWTLLRYEADWRWLAGRTDTPWYDSMRLFQQGPDLDWRPIIETVKAELATLSAETRSQKGNGRKTAQSVSGGKAKAPKAKTVKKAKSKKKAAGANKSKPAAKRKKPGAKKKPPGN